MKLAKIFIAFTFLLAFAICVSAQEQTPKIVWKNLQEKYESFYDIKPILLNSDNKPIYFTESYYSESVSLLHFDKTINDWSKSNPWRCGAGYKPSITKLKLQAINQVIFDKETWDDMTIGDGITVANFKSAQNYNGVGRYKFKFTFGLSKANYKSLEVFSPEFEVIEKDFKKK